MQFAAILAAFAAAAVTAQAPAPATLSMTFTGIDAKQGRIMLALYDEAGWNGGKPIRAAVADVTGDAAALSIADLPAGRYGAKIFHDVNGNGKMDTNPFGMPVEPFAFSNNARGAMGPAKWDDAAFTLDAAGTAQTISFR